MLQGTDREKIRQRTEKWVRAHLRNRMKVFHELQSAPLRERRASSPSSWSRTSG